MIRRAIVVLLSFGALLQAQTVAKLPEPADGTYNQTFSYDLTGIVFGDVDADDTLDVIVRSDYVSGTIRIQAKLYGASASLWTFDTGITATQNSNPLDVPLLAWDFDNDGDDEVYIQYYSGGVRRHKIVNGNTGVNLVDAAYPTNFGDLKSMVAIAYIGGRPRIACNLDLWSSARVDVFQAWTGSAWSLSAQTGFPYTTGRGIAHDMIITADVDVDSSDDEILAGSVVLNGDGTVRYDVRDVVPNNTHGNTDLTVIGFFRPDQPNKLVYVLGDGSGDNVTAVWAKTGELMWNYNMEDYFVGDANWTHWHSGYVRKTLEGAEALAIDRDTDRWALIDVATGAVVISDTTAPPYCSGIKPLFWDCDATEDCGGVNYNNGLYGRYDIGEDGCEEVFGHGTDSTKIEIRFNQSCSGCASKYNNRTYRQQAAQSASGYAPTWSNAIELTGFAVLDDPNNAPIITNVAASNIGLTTAVITWDTHEGATSQVEYGLTTAYGASTTLDTNRVLAHTVNLSGLTTGATYHFRVKSKDLANNTSTSGDYTFVVGCAL